MISTFESGLKAMAVMFLRFSKGKVYDLLLEVGFEYAATEETCRKTHFTRSKTETRFPTGLRTQFPSGVKMTFP